jgi:hypothetical protein
MYFEMITDIKAEPFYPETGYLPSFTPTVTQQEMEAHMAEHEAEDRRQLELIQSRLKNTQFFVETIHTVKLNDSEIEVGDYEDNSTGHGTTNDFDLVEHIDECDYAEEYEYDKEEDDISESGALTPNLIIKHYKVTQLFNFRTFMIFCRGISSLKIGPIRLGPTFYIVESPSPTFEL